MQTHAMIVDEFEPVLIERKCGGWLATTPRGYRLQIGVLGDSEDQARVNLFNSLEKWKALCQHAKHERQNNGRMIIMP